MIKIFVGCAPNHDDAESQAVLEYTIRKHATEPVDITWMKASRDPLSPLHGWDNHTWATPFSGFRWAVPHLCNYAGRAIYMDSDIIVRADIAELWNMDFNGADAVARDSVRSCVMLMDCTSYRFNIEYLQVKRGFRPVLNWGYFPDDHMWNCLDGEMLPLDDPRIKAIHYTSMPHQPHIPFAAKRLAADGRKHWFTGQIAHHWRSDLVDLFDRLLSEAEQEGFTVDTYCQDEIYGDFIIGNHGAISTNIPHWGKP